MANRRKDIENMDEVSGKTRSKHCQPCDRKNASHVAEVYCEDCWEYQCNECAKVHQHFSVMATHKLLNLSDAKFVSQRYDMKGLDLCKQHREILKFLCEGHNELCCSTCAFVNHRKCHSVMEIEEKAKVEGPVLSSLKLDLMDIDSKTKTFQKRISETKVQFVYDEKEIVGKIQDMQNKVNEQFEQLKRKVSHDKKLAMNDLDKKVASCDTYVANVEQYLTDIVNVTELGTPSQQMILFHHLKDQVRQLQQNTTKDMDELKDIRISFQFGDILQLPPSKSIMPGSLAMHFLTTRNRQENGTEKQEKDQRVNLKLLVSTELKQGEGDLKEPFYTGLDFLPDGRLVSVDNRNKKCVLHNGHLQLVRSLALPSTPQDVVAVSGDKVAVTTEAAKMIHFLEIRHNNKISLKHRRNVTFKYNSISVIDNEHFAVGTIDNPQPVRIVSVSGEEKELGINFPIKPYSLIHSKCTYIQNCKKVVLSDSLAHTVYIYDSASNTRVEVKDEKIIKEPRGVAVGPGDCLFVCSEETNTLVQISHTGQILSSHVLDMEYPYSISVSKDNTKLAVSNSATGKHKLQLYSIETQ